jgi:hypothetical protein
MNRSAPRTRRGPRPSYLSRIVNVVLTFLELVFYILVWIMSVMRKVKITVGEAISRLGRLDLEVQRRLEQELSRM